MSTTPVPMKNLKTPADSGQSAIGFNIKARDDVRTRVINGGKNLLFLERNGQRSPKDLKQLTKDILNQLKGAGRFEEFRLYLCKPEVADQIEKRRGTIKEYNPVNSVHPPWDLAMSGKEVVATAMATMLKQRENVLYFELNRSGLYGFIDTDNEFSPEADTYEPTVVYKPIRSKNQRGYSAAEQFNMS